MVDSKVDRVQFWRLSLPYKKSLAWLRAHPPRGLHADRSANGTGPDGPSAGDSYGDRPTDAWSSAELDVSVAPSGEASVVRLDGLVVWLDPRPWRDDASGHRMHVDVATGCPATHAHVVGVTNQGKDLNHQLLPSAQPRAGLICRYAGIGPSSSRLLQRIDLTQQSAGRIARAVRRLPLSHVDGGMSSCPSDNGSIAVIALTYRQRADVDVEVTLTGCGGIGNGSIRADSVDLSELIRQLE
jgi:hypothetical protein